MCIYKYIYYKYYTKYTCILSVEKDIEGIEKDNEWRKQILLRTHSSLSIKCGLLGLLASTLAQLCSPVLALRVTELPHITGPVEFCAHWALQMLCGDRVARHGCCLYLLGSHAWSIVSLRTLYLLYLQTGVQGKILKNFRTTMAEN